MGVAFLLLVLGVAMVPAIVGIFLHQPVMGIGVGISVLFYFAWETQSPALIAFSIIGMLFPLAQLGGVFADVAVPGGKR